VTAINLWAQAARQILVPCACAAAVLLLAGCVVQPKPLTDAERRAEAQTDLKSMFADQEPLDHALALPEAYQRAVKYNLDRRVKLMEEAVAVDGLGVANMDMLPRLTADAGYLNRSNVLAESSTSVLTGTQSLQPSTSTDSNRNVDGLNFSWNVLDFGVSYFVARQSADRVLIAAERRRKVAQNLLRDVRSAYWRAAAAQVLSTQIDRSIKDAEAALATSRGVETEALRSPLDALRYQRALLDLLRQLEEVRHRLMIANTELGALINLPPGREIVLDIPPEAQLTYEPLGAPIDRMEQVALVRNPDLREVSYQSRISASEVHKSILRLLPGINFVYGPQYDTNSFLVNNWWAEGAARVSWNLMALINGPRVIRQAKDSVKVVEAQRQAIAMAVLTKLHLAYQAYLDAGKEYARARALAQVDERIYGQVTNRTTAEAQGDLEPIVAGVASVASSLRRYESYSAMQAALGRLYDTVGIDIELADLAKLDAAVLVRKTDAIVASWERGETGGGPAPPAGESPQNPSQPPEPGPVAAAVSANEKPGFFDRMFKGQSAQ
jgi:outer membrane protein, multidrug efflux system